MGFPMEVVGQKSLNYIKLRSEGNFFLIKSLEVGRFRSEGELSDGPVPLPFDFGKKNFMGAVISVCVCVKIKGNRHISNLHTPRKLTF